ncbi:YiiX/YebB-like N1pC/P60 family cysteine hydrolase [Oceanobacillus timonensis]|uniref:YiiX/YebB-like N1pC/P60 family cysteine hydrolase n=1 Tax=Oceanobacillus timonensis TaxID=1926285 RepID=UPI0009BB5BB4|nr:YiiX/YebB-like N1pC/P60 family cysteine hydrolase [Oceanobacillus timonensis]
MNIKKMYLLLVNMLLLFFLIFLLSVQQLNIYAVIYAVSAVLLIGHLWLSQNKKTTKIIFTIIYLLIMSAQRVFNTLFVFSGTDAGILFLMKKMIAVIFMLVPFCVLYVMYLYTIQNVFSHSVKDAATISFNTMKEMQKSAVSLGDKLKKGRSSLSRENLNEIMEDIPRHSYTKYVNKNSLTDAFFEECQRSLADEHLYIVISSTGSPASELIAVFTQKVYNHVSISFDRDLKTIVSYNGGEKVSPPGLNQEQLMQFHKKDDAEILVYSLKVSREQKQMIIDKVKEMNDTGSVYNFVGLVTKFSVRPNIMFCSQFVYNMLKVAGLEYFQSPATKIKPTDLVEKDYFRKLAFCYQIKFNEL